MPSRPLAASLAPNSPTQSVDESDGVFDLSAELESLTDTVTLIDSDELPILVRALSPPPLEIEYTYLYRHFHSILHNQADFWSLVARESTLLLSRDLITNPAVFHSILPSLVFHKATVLPIVDAAIRKENALFIQPAPTPVSRTAFELASDGLREMVVSGLQGVAFSFLTRVWRVIVSLLHHPHLSVFGDHFYSSLRHSTDEVISPDTINFIITNTTWDVRFGYRFWHVLEGNSHISWFANTTTRYLLYETLANMSSGSYINIPAAHLNSTSAQDLMLTDIDLECIAERVAFVLAWVVVEMRALVLSCYVFKHSRVLTLERAECVVQEYMLINEFFSSITAAREDPQHYVGRREALRQFFTLAPV